VLSAIGGLLRVSAILRWPGVEATDTIYKTILKIMQKPQRLALPEVKRWKRVENHSKAILLRDKLLTSYYDAPDRK
jgi:hypothetical protein